MFVEVYPFVNLRLFLYFPLPFYHFHTIFHTITFINYFLTEAYEMFFKQQSVFLGFMHCSQKHSLCRDGFCTEGIRSPQSLKHYRSPSTKFLYSLRSLLNRQKLTAEINTVQPVPNFLLRKVSPLQPSSCRHPWLTVLASWAAKETALQGPSFPKPLL